MTRLAGLLILPLLLMSFSAFAEPDEHTSALAGLSKFKNYEVYRESSYDPTGANADGRHDWPMQPGETRTLADIQGAGAIVHIWTTIATKDEQHLRNLVIRMYWDGESAPSVEAPIGDFFGLGHGKYYQYSSLPIQIGTDKGLNCFWRMPFSTGAKITVTNDGPIEGEAFYYYVDYQKYDSIPADEGRFHAQYRQAFPCGGPDNYVFMEATGRGHYVGCNLSIHNRAGGWWGEGDDMFYIDGEEKPRLLGTGSEDYFCGAWAYGATFSNLHFGCPLNGGHVQNALWNVYRYHIEDPIPFKKSIKATIEHGTGNNRFDDFSSVAYWYQSEPHAAFPPLPKAKERFHTEATMFVEDYCLEAEDLAPLFANPRVAKQETLDIGNFWSRGAHLLFKAEAPEAYKATLPPTPSDAGQFQLEVWYTAGPDYGIAELWFNGVKLCQWDGFNSKLERRKVQEKRPITLKAEGNVLELRVVGKNEKSGGYLAGFDCYRANPQ